MTDQGNLIIRDTARSDSGEYICEAQNMFGKRMSEPAKLRVMGKSFLVHQLQPLHKRLGLGGVCVCVLRPTTILFESRI